MKYATFNAAGKLNGRYDSNDDVPIPESAVAITDQLFRQTVSETDGVWMRDAEGVVSKQPFPTAVKNNADVKAEIAATRYTHETAGIELDGMAIDTGRDSQQLITGARLAAIEDPAYVCNWKTATGPLVLNAALLKTVAGAVRAHVQRCFDREIELLSALDAGEFTEQMLAEGWPSPVQTSSDTATGETGDKA